MEVMHHSVFSSNPKARFCLLTKSAANGPDGHDDEEGEEKNL